MFLKMWKSDRVLYSGKNLESPRKWNTLLKYCYAFENEKQNGKGNGISMKKSWNHHEWEMFVPFFTFKSFWIIRFVIGY